MTIGVPKEIKNREYRVGLVPSGVQACVEMGHKVFVERQAGEGSGISDEEYKKVGAYLTSQEECWAQDLVIKVKEPLPSEFPFLRPHLILFTFLHLAAEKELTEALLKNKVTSIGYETIQDDRGQLPLLRPMSEIAGRMSIQVGAYYLSSSWDEKKSGRGVLLSGVAGVRPGRVVILGGGVSGINAAQVALGMGANVTVLDSDHTRLEYLDQVLHGRLITLMSNYENIEKSILMADLVIGAVLLPGSSAPKLISQSLVRHMKKGSVLIDIAVDQGGCSETSRPTSHQSPIFIVDGVIHYCVTNMPGAMPYTSTLALTNVTQKYILALCADSSIVRTLKNHPHLKRGLNTFDGHIVHKAVADSLHKPYQDFDALC